MTQVEAYLAQRPQQETIMDTTGGWVTWFTGLPGSGKTTLARAVRRALQEHEISTILIDSDELRRLMTADTTYAPAERDRLYNRLVELAVWLARSGEHVLIAATGSQRCYREAARTQLGPRFAQVWVRCLLAVCGARDPKGLYGRAAAGLIHGLPGVDAPYEAPDAPEVIVDTDRQTLDQAAEIVLASLPLFECAAAVSA
jgi:adenylyl-sulfate kinase